jgi:hypothetical protein
MAVNELQRNSHGVNFPWLTFTHKAVVCCLAPKQRLVALSIQARRSAALATDKQKATGFQRARGHAEFMNKTLLLSCQPQTRQYILNSIKRRDFIGHTTARLLC